MHDRQKARPAFQGTLILLLSLCTLAGCGGGSASSNSQTAGNTNTQGTLAVSPASLNFGNVAVGSSSSLNASLTASNSGVVVSSAAWNGSGFSLSGINFPVTIPAGQTVNYTVTFTPPAAGGDSGTVSFTNNGSDATTQQSFTGTGTATAGPSVALSWIASTTTVTGYNMYRGAQSGGPYAKLNSSLIAGTSYTDGTVQSGSTYYYVATSVDSNNVESSYSGQASATIP